jgi:hypothetical protein
MSPVTHSPITVICGIEINDDEEGPVSESTANSDPTGHPHFPASVIGSFRVDDESIGWLRNRQAQIAEHKSTIDH